MEVTDEINNLSGVGPKLEQTFKALEIATIEDLLYFFPRDYQDFSNVSTTDQLEPGDVTLRVKIVKVNSRYVRRGLHITEAVAEDKQGSVKLIWFNQPYRKNAIKTDVEYFAAGNYQYQRNRYLISNPSLEQVSAFPLNAARIVPIYPQRQGLKSHQIRKCMKAAVSLKIGEIMPPEIVAKHKLMPLDEAFMQMHFPSSQKLLESARQRFGFEELFAVLYASLLIKGDNKSFNASKISFKQALAKEFVKALPYSLTPDQKRSAWEILQDIDSQEPMNRLLEGDVGSGKTVVAAMALEMSAAADLQSFVMAPTTILANQHFKTLQQLLPARNIDLLTSSIIGKPRAEVLKRLSSGQTDILIGTHALVQPEITPQRLGLCIVDEQHRFGVEQRRALINKNKAKMPHVLTMTATPIPRSLALVLYGDLDISILASKPKGRLAPKTKLTSPNSRSAMYKHVLELSEQGQQAYIIYPLIEESDTLSLNSLSKDFEKLKNGTFKNRRVAMIHGRLPKDQRDQTMAAFASGEIDILVATTVIEVGVDVPNAAIVVIESAERFGLAQLHQIRGRVGRSDKQSYCYLVPTTSVDPPRRLKEMVLNDDGFALAELDLELRGPGEIYGARQHGALDLRIAKLTDVKLIKSVKEVVQKLVEDEFDLLQYPRLNERIVKLRSITSLN